MMRCWELSRAGRRSLLAVAALSLLSGSLLLGCTDTLYTWILNSQMVVQEGSASYAAWLETPIPTFTKFYFFSMLNPRELFHRKEMPILEEVGPYTFREVERKVNITWHDNGTVSYRRMKHWYFEPSMSVGPLTNTVTTINVPVVGSAEFARGDFINEWGMSEMLATMQATVFVKKTIGELLFDGYDDIVMEIGNSFTEDEYADDGFGFAEEEEEESEKIPMDRFGWFYKRNGTSWSDGTLLMDTGVSDVHSLGKILAWNGRQRTDAYPGPCGQVSGSSDGLFPPGKVDESDSLSIYSTDLCRPLTFTKAGKSSLHGISVQKFQLDENSFANGTVCPANSCYGNNLRTGVQNVTQCKVKSPAFVSRPHFHLADPFYRDQFQFGLEADPSLHDSSIWVEPASSIPVKVEVRLQLNILLESVPGIDYLFRDLQKVMFPVMWFESVAELPQEMASSIHMLVSLPTMFQGSGITSLAVGVLLVLLVLWQGDPEKEGRCRGRGRWRARGAQGEVVPVHYRAVTGEDKETKQSIDL